MLEISPIGSLPGWQSAPPTSTEDGICLRLSSPAVPVPCPTCAGPTHRHGRYCRTLAALPWDTCRATLVLQLNRFRCTTSTCPRQTFVEPVPTVAPAFARRTLSLATAQRAIALATGGAAGARLAAALHMPTSGATLIRLIRSTPLPPSPLPTAIGVDDWAMRKRHRYGALICDLDTHRPLDLLPDRSADTLAAWLQAHPQITVISRDRGGAFAEGARRGAPQAMQVADRFHLLQNLYTSAQAAVGRIAAPIQAALRDWRLATHGQETAPLERTSGHPPSAARTERRATRRTERHTQFERLVALGAAGWTQPQIARELGVSQRTIQRWQSHPDLRTRKPRTRTGSCLDRYRAFILAQWQTGCQSGAALYRALQAQGYHGSYRLVTCYLAQLFPATTAPKRREPASRQQPPVLPAWTPHALAWLCMRDPETLTTDDTAILDIVQTAHPEGAVLYRQIQAFRQLVRTRPPDGLNGWMADIDAHGCPELQRFVQGLRRDEDAVQAGLREKWSNGQTEGHIHRLKLLKRSMYGRAKLDLLRIRLLAG